MVLLAIVGVLNYADRFLPAVLAEPIRVELELSDTAIGVINGFGFLLVYAVLGLFIARIADRGAFGLVVSACLTLWGAMTMLGGAVVSGLALALTRSGSRSARPAAPRRHTPTWRATSCRSAGRAAGGDHRVDPVGVDGQPDGRRAAGRRPGLAHRLRGDGGGQRGRRAAGADGARGPAAHAPHGGHRVGAPTRPPAGPAGAAQLPASSWARRWCRSPGTR
ncbi:arabinose efflux permease family domain protein [Mycolicibacterium hassiacum DSM 44199]|uniref:Arabinose efflux permease family domain protein n=1 Tax=Mycolicibacterium hassiacum (strain DSM 44199 / CIP 105218 / JCM 12690 / 3849) TaxID=1122247 RepID=K5BAI4_MYCHD|nr:arabinose efflux permease family domain protein [Mycolicibacterium hassiacum DSM 44199]